MPCQNKSMWLFIGTFRIERWVEPKVVWRSGMSSCKISEIPCSERNGMGSWSGRSPLDVYPTFVIFNVDAIKFRRPAKSASLYFTMKSILRTHCSFSLYNSSSTWSVFGMMCMKGFTSTLGQVTVGSILQSPTHLWSNVKYQRNCTSCRQIWIFFFSSSHKHLEAVVVNASVTCCLWADSGGAITATQRALHSNSGGVALNASLQASHLFHGHLLCLINDVAC